MQIQKNKKTPKKNKRANFIFNTQKIFFDLIIIDECHRGGANEEGSWRAVLEYFSYATQLGLTATPKKEENIDTYEYFGE
ncbi:DEAD/DEAH box helicase family protein, partial [Campylobacter jejuni]